MHAKKGLVILCTTSCRSGMQLRCGFHTKSPSKASLLLVPKSFSLLLAIVRMIVLLSLLLTNTMYILSISTVSRRKLVNVCSPETTRFTITNLCSIFYCISHCRELDCRSLALSIPTSNKIYNYNT